MIDPLTALIIVKEGIEVARVLADGVERIRESSKVQEIGQNPLRADDLTRLDRVRVAREFRDRFLDRNAIGEIGEKLFKAEQERRGAQQYAEQIKYGDIQTKTERCMDAQYLRPRGSTYEQYVPSARTGGRLVEKTSLLGERCYTEVKNYSPESLTWQSDSGSHLFKQLNAMKEGLPGKIELALPRDTILAPESQDFLRKVDQMGVRIIGYTSRGAQAAAGLGRTA